MGEGGTAHGLTTVVFVDVEGSTALLDRVGDRSGLASVARQLDVVAELVGEYGGQAVKSTGDGMLITFSSPRQAVLFGVASQRRLAVRPRRCASASTPVRPTASTVIHSVRRSTLRRASLPERRAVRWSFQTWSDC